VSYVGPNIEAGALTYSRGTTTIGTIGEHIIIGTTTLGGDTLTIRGENFGADVNDIWIPYGAGIDTDSFTYNCTNIILMNSTYLTCQTQSGVGRNYHFFVVVTGLPSRISDDSFSYPSPIIDDGALRVVGGAPGIAVDATTTQGDKLLFTGKNFGRISSQMKVTYASNSSTVLDCLIDALLSNDTHMYCQASPGEGSNKVFTITAGVLVGTTYRYVVTGSDVYSYPATPIITSVSGCSSNPSNPKETIDCPTDARTNTNQPILLTITGQFLPAYPLVTIGSRSCEGPKNDPASPTTKLTCTLPVGTGLSLPVVVSKGSYFSIARDALLVSYALPKIDVGGVVGCNISVPDFDGGASKFCARSGGTTITITGSQFGYSGAKVLIGGLLCANPVHRAGNEHRQVTCNVPANTGLLRGVLLFQLGCEKKGDQTATINYEPCAAGTIPVLSSTSCNRCARGAFAAKSGQDKCLLCAAGKYANSTGLSTCTSCIAGAFASYQNSSSCTSCPAGKYIGTPGAADCLVIHCLFILSFLYPPLPIVCVSFCNSHVVLVR
jgi:hypothetical protein